MIVTLELTNEQVEAIKASIKPEKIDPIKNKEGIISLLRDNIEDTLYGFNQDAVLIADIIQAMAINCTMTRSEITKLVKEFVDLLLFQCTEWHSDHAGN
jgi:hypothetical protein